MMDIIAPLLKKLDITAFSGDSSPAFYLKNFKNICNFLEFMLDYSLVE